MMLRAIEHRIENLMSGPNGHRILNAVLSALALSFGAWLLAIWLEPLDLSASKEKKIAVEAKADKLLNIDLSGYSVIVEKDLFSPARQKYVIPRPKPVAPPPPPGPPPRRPPPRLTLIGTVLLDDREAAIMEYGGSRKVSYYKVGDMIEEFAIKDVRKDSVILKRDDGEILKVTMSQSSGQQGGFFQPDTLQGQTGQGGIPSELLPRPRVQGVGAVQSSAVPNAGVGYRPVR